MVKKITGYILLCCLLNVLTTLPAKCCEAGAHVHRHSGNTPARSLTILQHLLGLMDDESSSGDAGIDVHCSVYHETRPVSVRSIQLFICEAGDPTISIPLAEAARHRTYSARRFAVPQHHHFLFRLTPF